MTYYAVRNGRTYHTTQDCPIYRRWWYRMQMLLSVSGLRKCQFCQRLEERK